MGHNVKKRRSKIGKYKYRRHRKSKSNKYHDNEHTILSEEDWDTTKPATKNFNSIGLAYNLNKIIKPPNQIEQFIPNYAKAKENSDSQVTTTKAVEKMEERAAKFTRSKFLPPNYVKFLEYLLDKYGENYKAMSRDGRNYDQFTPIQLRQAIMRFKDCDDQYAKFLKRREMITPTHQKDRIPRLKRRVFRKIN